MDWVCRDRVLIKINKLIAVTRINPIALHHVRMLFSAWLYYLFCCRKLVVVFNRIVAASKKWFQCLEEDLDTPVNC